MSDSYFLVFELNTSGLRCPLPILKTKKQLATMQNGEVLRVLTTDPHAVEDFKVFIQQAKHNLLSYGESEGVFFFFIQRR